MQGLIVQIVLTTSPPPPHYHPHHHVQKKPTLKIKTHKILAQLFFYPKYQGMKYFQLNKALNGQIVCYDPTVKLSLY